MTSTLVKLTSIAFFCSATTAYALAPDAGAIGKIKGSGVLERNGAVVTGDTGVGVKSMDTAVTANGQMQINFVDETRVDITEHSRLLIDEFMIQLTV